MEGETATGINGPGTRDIKVEADTKKKERKPERKGEGSPKLAFLFGKPRRYTSTASTAPQLSAARARRHRPRWGHDSARHAAPRKGDMEGGRALLASPDLPLWEGSRLREYGAALTCGAREKEGGRTAFHTEHARMRPQSPSPFPESQSHRPRGEQRTSEKERNRLTPKRRQSQSTRRPSSSVASSPPRTVSPSQIPWSRVQVEPLPLVAIGFVCDDEDKWATICASRSRHCFLLLAVSVGAARIPCPPSRRVKPRETDGIRGRQLCEARELGVAGVKRVRRRLDGRQRQRDLEGYHDSKRADVVRSDEMSSVGPIHPGSLQRQHETRRRGAVGVARDGLEKPEKLGC
ncbi:hypothetical protein B0H16DRAFT_1475665 [Mycena metata]|uniref:Uncharacterized protein n=1 Tax=Mycena metata TaxID=1033252 RepID=A0AAD7HDX4_9AGAR|nr:hypothetical protein B0H16DRAFT_1475665 [Mycena metata]